MARIYIISPLSNIHTNHNPTIGDENTGALLALALAVGVRYRSFGFGLAFGSVERVP